MPYTTIDQLPSSHLISIRFVLRSPRRLGHSDVPLLLPSLFLFIDKEWQRDHNLMYTYYLYLLTAFNHQMSGLSDEWEDGVFDAQVGGFSQTDELILTLETFWSAHWNHLLRAVVSDWPRV